MYMFDYNLTLHNIIRWQPDVTSATVVAVYIVKFPGIFNVHSTTNKSTYVNFVHHRF
jgi:hypothetical protein